jgi:hypothetical protein
LNGDLGVSPSLSLLYSAVAVAARIASSRLGDKMQIDIDDDGRFDRECSGVYVGNALCASDMADVTSTASSCQAYQNTTTRMTTFYSSSAAAAVGGSESL